MSPFILKKSLYLKCIFIFELPKTSILSINESSVVQRENRVILESDYAEMFKFYDNKIAGIESRSEKIRNNKMGLSECVVSAFYVTMLQSSPQISISTNLKKWRKFSIIWLLFYARLNPPYFFLPSEKLLQLQVYIQADSSKTFLFFRNSYS